MNGYLIAGCVLGVLSLLLIAVIYVLLSVKQKKDEVKEVLPKVLSRVNTRFLDTLVISYVSNEKSQCYINVSNKKTLVNSLGRDYVFFNSNFPGGAGFDKLFEIVLSQLMEFEKCVCERTFCIKCCFDASADSKAMNDYQMIRAVFCAVYAFGIIHKTSTLMTVKVVLDSKHDYAVNEILRDRNYQDFYACDGSSPSMSEYLEKYMQST